MDIVIVKTVAMRDIEESPLVRKVGGNGSDSKSMIKSQTDILHEIREDHLYVATSSNTTENAKLAKPSHWQPSSANNQRGKDLRYAMWTSPHVGPTVQTNPEEKLEKPRQEDQDVMLLPDANEIQKVFENMIDMTSLFSLTENALDNSDTESDDGNESEEAGVHEQKWNLTTIDVNNSLSATEEKKIGNVDNGKRKDGATTEKNSSNNSIHDDNTDTVPKTKPEEKKVVRHRKRREKKCSKKNADAATTKEKCVDGDNDKNGNASKEQDKSIPCKKVGEKEWRDTNRRCQNAREMDMLFERATRLLVRQWGEYVTMTTEEVRHHEVKNAREMGMVQEVIEMLEDTGRYVWELIDELIFF